MKVLQHSVYTFKRGDIYGVDDLEVVPKGYSEHFDDEDFQIREGEYEYGSAKCVKGLEVTVIVKSN